MRRVAATIEPTTSDPQIEAAHCNNSVASRVVDLAKSERPSTSANLAQGILVLRPAKPLELLAIKAAFRAQFDAPLSTGDRFLFATEAK